MLMKFPFTSLSLASLTALALASSVASAQDRPSAPDQCRQGFVWRDAFPGDHVCVEPWVREQAAADNAAAPDRRRPADWCSKGYVWRDARPGDHVCVTPETRARTWTENEQALSRISSVPAHADAKTSVDFMLATCRPAMEDLGKVDVMARENNWTPATAEEIANVQQNGFKLRSTWHLKLSGEELIVQTGTGDGTSNVCIVMFPDRTLLRNEFYSVMSGASELTPMGNMDFAQAGRMEIFEMKSEGPVKQLFELMSLNDGKVVMAGLLQVPATP